MTKLNHLSDSQALKQYSSYMKKLIWFISHLNGKQTFW